MRSDVSKAHLAGRNSRMMVVRSCTPSKKSSSCECVIKLLYDVLDGITRGVDDGAEGLEGGFESRERTNVLKPRLCSQLTIFG